MTDRPKPIEYWERSDEMYDRAGRGKARFYRQQDIAGKLDEVLGPVDGDDERGGLGYMQGRGGIK